MQEGLKELLEKTDALQHEDKEVFKNFIRTGYISGNVDGKKEIIDIIKGAVYEGLIDEDSYNAFSEKITNSLAKDKSYIDDSLKRLSGKITNEKLKEGRVSPL